VCVASFGRPLSHTSDVVASWFVCGSAESGGARCATRLPFGQGERASGKESDGGGLEKKSVGRESRGLGGRERGKEERERERAGRGCGMLRSLHERKRENVRWKMFVDILYATSQDKRIPSPIDESPDR
jgi:hypothetical protein